MPADDDLPDGHRAPVTAAAVSPGGGLAVTGSADGEVRFWDLRHGELRASIGGLDDQPVTGAAFTGETDLITAGGGISCWTLGDGTMAWRRLSWESGARSLLLGHGGDSAMVALDDDVRWLGLDGSWHGRFKASRRIDALAVTASGRVVTGDDHGTVRAWSLPPRDRWGDPGRVWTFDEHGPARQRLMRCFDGGRLVVSPRRERAVVLDAETGALVSTFALGRQTAIAAHPDAPLVVLGGWDGSLTWWDASTGQRLGRVQAHDGRIRALALAPKAGLVLSAGQDGTAALWRMHARKPLARFSPAPPNRPAVPYGHEDPWALTTASGTPDGRNWLIGGAGGQVHLLEGELVPQRVGRPTHSTGALDLETLVEDFREYWRDVPECAAASRALMAPGALAHLGDQQASDEVVGALEDLTRLPEDPRVREAAFIALGEIDKSEATTAFYSMIQRHGPAGGTAGRIRAHFTGQAEPTTDELIASLPGSGNFLGVLTSSTLGERGAAAVPAVHEALRAFPLPADEDSEDWFADETTKYRLMHALRVAGPAAAPATPTLLAILEDEEIYRDTRHSAEVTLQAIGLPETADVIAAEIRRRADSDDDDDDDGYDYGLLLEVLSGMPAATLATAREVGPALAAVRREHGDGLSTYEDLDGETREYTVYEIRLADLATDKIADHAAALTR